MKPTPELLSSAHVLAKNIANEITNGSGKTHASLTRLLTEARVLLAALNELQQRALGSGESLRRD